MLIPIYCPYKEDFVVLFFFICVGGLLKQLLDYNSAKAAAILTVENLGPSEVLGGL